MTVSFYGTFDRGHSANRLLARAVEASGFPVETLHEALWERQATKDRRFFGAASLAGLAAGYLGAARRLAARWRVRRGPAPVVVVGSTHYRGKGFTLDPQTWEEYFELLGQVLASPAEYRLSQAQVADAWHYAHSFFFDYPHPFPWHVQEIGLVLLAVAVFGAGAAFAGWGFGKGMVRATALAPQLGFLRRLLHRKWFVDELYDRLDIRPFWRLCDALNALDKWVVDGAVNLAPVVAEVAGHVIKLLQTGVARHYALWLLGGAVIVLWIMIR